MIKGHKKQELERLLKEQWKKEGKVISEAPKSKPQKDSDAVLKQKLIILHQLGIIKSIDLPNTKLSKLLSVLLDAGQENIRKNLSSINDYKEVKPTVKTEANLKYVIELFKSLGLDEHKQKLEPELEQVMKNK